MNNEKKINSITYNMILLTIILLVFYAPNIGNRDYLGIIIVYSFAILFSLVSKIQFDKIGLSIILYAFVIVIIDLVNMLIYSSSVLYVLRIFIYALIPIVSYLVGKFLSARIDIVFFNKSIIFIGVMQAMFGVLQVYSNKFRIFSLANYANFEKYNYGFENWAVGRVVGTIGNPNTYGVFMIVIILFLMNIIIPQKHKNKNKVPIIISFILCVYAVTLSQSRTAYLLLALGILVSVLFRRKNKLRNFLIMLILILIFIFVFINVPFLSRRFSINSILNFGNRLPIWKTYINEYLNPININLIIGYGSKYIRDIGKAVDNYYLQIILQYGIIGLFSYCIMIFALFKSFKKVNNKNIKNFLIISYSIVLISDFLGTVNQHVDFTILLFLVFGFYINNTRLLRTKFNNFRG